MAHLAGPEQRRAVVGDADRRASPRRPRRPAPRSCRGRSAASPPGHPARSSSRRPRGRPWASGSSSPGPAHVAGRRACARITILRARIGRREHRDIDAARGGRPAPRRERPSRRIASMPAAQDPNIQPQRAPPAAPRTRRPARRCQEQQYASHSAPHDWPAHAGSLRTASPRAATTQLPLGILHREGVLAGGEAPLLARPRDTRPSAFSISAKRSAYCLTNFGVNRSNMPSRSCSTSTWPSHPPPAPMPMVGMRSFLRNARGDPVGHHLQHDHGRAGLFQRLRRRRAAAARRRRSCPARGSRPACRPTAGVRPMWPITVMPALRDRAHRSAPSSRPPSSLTASMPASFRKRPALRTASAAVGLVGHERHVADQIGVLCAPPHGLAVMDHLLHRHRHGRVVAQHDHAQRIADQDRVQPGPVGGQRATGSRRR